MSLEKLLERASEKITDFYDLPQIVNWLLGEIENKRKLTPYLKKKIIFSYSAYKKWKNNKDITKKTAKKNPKQINELLNQFYGSNEFEIQKKITIKNFNKVIPVEKNFDDIVFFRRKNFLDDSFRFYFTKIFPFSNLRLKKGRQLQIFPRDLMINYTYEFTEIELAGFEKYRLTNNLNSESLITIIELFFTAVIYALGIMMNNLIEGNFLVELMCARSNILNSHGTINFCLSVRQRESVLRNFYLKTHIFHFSELFSADLVPTEFKNKLRLEKDLIYLLALSRYDSLEPYITVMHTKFYRKCILLNHITPLLGYMNFVLSRVQDSTFKISDLLEDTFKNLKLDKKTKKIFTELYNFCDTQATIYAMFQSHNSPQTEEQMGLFIFYMMNFFSGGTSVVGDNIYFKDLYKKKISHLYDSKPEYKKYEPFFKQFISEGMKFIHFPSIEVFFQKSFDIDVTSMNEEFFGVFVNSLNRKFFSIIDKYSKKNDEKEKLFHRFIDFIIKALLYMSKTIFLEKNPGDASNNFKDRISRYSPKKVALRALELLMFLEMPLSDNNWRNYELSRNHQLVVKVFQNYITIPDDYFFSNINRLHINRTFLYGLDYKILLEEWLVSKILIPFFSLMDRLMVDVKNQLRTGAIEKKTFERSQLSKIIFQKTSSNIIDPQIRDNLEVISDGMGSIFYDSALKIIQSI